MIRAFQIGFAFLTVFRVALDPPPDLKEVGRAAWSFPIVGAVMGTMLAVERSVLQEHASLVLGAVLVVGTWVFLTGGLHLDGWTDCWDALAAAVSPERRLEIMKDSRLGTFGALALILLLAVKTAAVADVGLSVAALFAAPVVGRGTMVLAAHGAHHRGEGMGAMFVSGLDARTVAVAAAISAAVSLAVGLAGMAAAAAAYGGAVWFRRFAEARLLAVSGDVLGGMCEFSETIFLVMACIKW